MIDMLNMSGDELHLVSMVNHRLLNASIYGSVAVLKSGGATLSKTHMSIRATSLGVTSFEFPDEKFVTWAFTRNPDICEQLGQSVAGCSVVEDSHVQPGGYLTYCERVYLNPLTGTGPDWPDLISAWLYRAKLDEVPQRVDSLPRALPPAVPVRVLNGTVPLHFAHIIKTGGESLELHLAAQPAPRLDYGACRAAALARAWPNSTAPQSCVAMARAVSLALCGANCECCAEDLLEASRQRGGFRGTILRSPRAHVLSLLSHCHAAHHNTWQRLLEDVPQYGAEVLLRVTEFACNSYCTRFRADPAEDLRSLLEDPSLGGQVQAA